MSVPHLDRILLEASPGEIRAVALADGVPWDIAIERVTAACGRWRYLHGARRR